MTIDAFNKQAPGLRQVALKAAAASGADADAAEDVAQETLLRLWQMRDDPRLYNPEGYASTIARHLTLNQRRRQPALPLDERQAQDWSVPSPLDLMLQREDERWLQERIRNLPFTQHADNCYTVGFFLSENTDYRNTYTLEWSETDGDSVKGRVITTFGPVASKAHSLKLNSVNWPLEGYGFDTDAFNAQMEKLQAGMEQFNEGVNRLKTSAGTVIVSSTTGAESASSWMKKMLFYLDKIQRDGNDSRYIYLSKLYELCKNTGSLDQQDLKIALQQVTTCCSQMKSKKHLTENELLFLQSMAELLQARIQ